MSMSYRVCYLISWQPGAGVLYELFFAELSVVTCAAVVIFTLDVCVFFFPTSLGFLSDTRG